MNSVLNYGHENNLLIRPEFIFRPKTYLHSINLNVIFVLNQRIKETVLFQLNRKSIKGIRCSWIFDA